MPVSWQNAPQSQDNDLHRRRLWPRLTPERAVPRATATLSIWLSTLLAKITLGSNTRCVDERPLKAVSSKDRQGKSDKGSPTAAQMAAGLMAKATVRQAPISGHRAARWPATKGVNRPLLLRRRRRRPKRRSPRFRGHRLRNRRRHPSRLPLGRCPPHPREPGSTPRAPG